MSVYKNNPSMQRLADSLGATGVLSDDYRRNIEGWALAAVGEGYHRGKADGRDSAVAQIRSLLDSLDSDDAGPWGKGFQDAIKQLRTDIDLRFGNEPA